MKTKAMSKAEFNEGGRELGGKDYQREARTLLTWLTRGRQAAERVSKKAVSNLEKNGFVEGDKLIATNEDDKEFSMWLYLAVLGVKGYIKQGDTPSKRQNRK